jgi:hypothetical protein
MGGKKQFSPKRENQRAEILHYPNGHSNVVISQQNYSLCKKTSLLHEEGGFIAHFSCSSARS